MRRAALAALAALLLAASPVSASAGIGWRQAPVGLTVYSNATTANQEPWLSESVADWNASPSVELVAAGLPPKGTTRINGYTFPCGEKRGAIVVCVSDVPAALTILRVKGGHISGAFIALWIMPNQGWTCQELGHALGLNHSEGDPDSCMNGPVGGIHPSAQDFADLAAMYGP
jgi:hypothetical protein